MQCEDEPERRGSERRSERAAGMSTLEADVPEMALCHKSRDVSDTGSSAGSLPAEEVG